MNRNEILDLLSLAACFDQRTVGVTDGAAWLAVANAEGWTFPLAQRALLEHYAQRRERIMPADISRRINEARLRAHETFQIPDHPPELADNGSAYVAWARDAKAKHMKEHLKQWANTGTLPLIRELEN